MASTMNREQWLTIAARRMGSAFGHAHELPENLRVSVGFPRSARGRGAGRITEFYRDRQSDGGMVEVFVSPTVGTAPIACRALGLELARIALRHEPTDAERVRLFEVADAVAAQMPDFPHDALNVTGTSAARVSAAVTTLATVGGTDAPAVPGPGSRLIKAWCAECGYTVRVTRRWLAVGAPMCPTHGQPMMYDSSTGAAA